MSLEEYRRKRRFDKTREPRPRERPPEGKRVIFVVQLHHARRRHFDLRLQVGDALKSWAVPKGPSFDPATKRLAVQVEDHPLDYADFEGDIAPGEYGAGHVDIFDHGVWATEGDAEQQLAKGHLHFELFGAKLKGGWNLVRSSEKERQQPWFLIKAKDGFAADIEADDLLDAKEAQSTRKAMRQRGKKPSTVRAACKPLPRLPGPSRAALGKAAAAIDGASEETITTASFKPELATLRDRLPIGPEWLYEVKWDGYRILAAVADGRAALWSRNGISWNEKIPEIGRALEQLGITAARLDGELIALVDGKNDFNALQKTLAGEAEAPLAYMMFDLLHLEGRDLERVPLVRRKELLAKLLSRAQLPLAYSTHVEGDGEAAWEMATREKLEGVVCKRAASPYRAGRGDDWIKVKLRASDEFAVVGYTPPKGSRIGFGSLLLASPSATGWRYRGRVGSGFSQSQLRELERTVAMNGGKEPPIAITGVDPLLRRALWVKPRAVVEVMAHGIGANGLLRQPSLKAVRADKSPDDLRDGDRAPARKAGSEARRGRKPAEREAAADDDVKITHPDRVVFPEGNFTKENVADYYETVMESFLPGVIGRPTSVIRCPSGIGKPCFFQKHLMAGLKQGEGARLKEENGGEAVYICPESAASVIELVQFGAIEFHPWGSTSADPDHATRMIFDLDPGPGVAWKRVVAAARLVRELLTQVALEPFLRTTGGKGLHVLVPLNPPSPWPAVKQFARAFAESLAKMHPSELVAQAARSERADRIYIDYLRNDRGATSVASYSLRARPGAPVAAPVGWSELGKLKGGNAYDIRSTPKRLARRHEDPWAGIDALRQVLPELKSRGE